MRRAGALLIVLAVVLAGCAAPGGRAPTLDGPPQRQQPTGPKRVTVAIMGDPSGLSNTIDRAGAGGTPGLDAVEELVNAGLSQADAAGVLQPRLGESVPSLENGQWRVQPDGRMETTFRIKPNVLWHDGTPLTADDLVFTVMVGRDRDLPALSNAAYGAVDRVEATDPRTVVVHWQRPFIQADTMFTHSLALPVSKHLLEVNYLEDKANFIQAPYWSIGFAGTGPFKVREWTRSSHMVLAANDAYVLGRPRVDEIEVRFIQDPNALIANILAGEVEINLGRGMSLEQGISIRDQWRDGKLAVRLSSWIAAYPQFLNPNPPALADARFRRALLQLIDRQAMVDSIQFGQSAVAHSYVSPAEPEYRDIEPSIVKYDFDPRSATTAIESLGYSRGADGSFRSADGQRLEIEIRTTGGDDFQEKSMFSVSDYWQRGGIQMDPVVVPRQRATDREYRANFPGFELVRQPNALTPDAVTRMHGSEASLPDNNYRGSNRMRYRSPELDALIDRFYVTIPRQERTQVLAQMMRHTTEQVVPVGIYYNTEPTMIANRLVNVASGADRSSPAWNAHEWDTARP
jgi:peptide/nickel transport system substrate-binding protein